MGDHQNLPRGLVYAWDGGVGTANSRAALVRPFCPGLGVGGC